MTHPTHTPMPHRPIAALAVVTGALMLTYLLLRPYGDSRSVESVAAADAFASPLWIWSHLSGAAALVTLAALWFLLAHGAIRWTALAGTALALPYYGAETFALHVIGVQARVDPSVLTLVPDVRDHPVAMTLFGAGLVALAVSGIAAALAWRHAQSSARSRAQNNQIPSRVVNAFLPLAVVAALFLPQFFLPPTGRVIYGIAFAATAAYAASTVTAARARDATTV